MKNKYSTQDYKNDTMARALGKDLSISTKKSIEICNLLRNKSTKNAKQILENVISKKQAVPFRRFTMEIPHRKNVGPGKYPVHASMEFLRLIKEVETNAQQKGLNASNLIIRNAIANKSSRPWHFGRQRRRKMKRTHLEIIVEERSKKK